MPYSTPHIKITAFHITLTFHTHVTPHFTSHHNSHRITPPHLGAPFHITPTFHLTPRHAHHIQNINYTSHYPTAHIPNRTTHPTLHFSHHSASHPHVYGVKPFHITRYSTTTFHILHQHTTTFPMHHTFTTFHTSSDIARRHTMSHIFYIASYSTSRPH